MHVSEGIEEEDQLYVRREWASSKFGLVEMQVPDDFTSHGWGPVYIPESSDTWEEVYTHLDRLVRDGVLTTEERARSEKFYEHVFNNGEQTQQDLGDSLRNGSVCRRWFICFPDNLGSWLVA